MRLARSGDLSVFSTNPPALLTLQRQNGMVSDMKAESKRATVYFDRDVHWALRHKAATTEKTISELVNDAVKLSLREDADDMATFERRRREPSLSFEAVLKDLKRRGKL